MPESRTIEIEYNPVYQEALDFKGRYLILYGGAGSGKSIFAGQKILMRLIHEPQHRFLVLRKVDKTIRDSCFKLFKDLIIENELAPYFKIKENEMNIIYTPNGNEIMTSGLDNVEKLKSVQKPSGVWVEEATELDKQDFKQIDLRLRGKLANYKQMIFTFNPVYINHWLNKLQLSGEVMRLKTTYKDNLFIDEQYKAVIENFKNEDENMYRVYGLGEWGLINMAERVYYEFSRQRNMFKGWEFKQGDELILGFDFNVNPMCAVLVAVRDGIYSQVKEWRVNHSHTAEICEIIIHDLSNMDFDRQRSIVITGDSSGRAKNTKGYMSDYEIIEKAFADALVNFYMSIPTTNPAIRDRINYTNTMLKLGKYRINETCEHSITDRELVTWKKKAEGFVLDKSNQDLTHLADAGDYVLYNTKNVWGVETAAQKLTAIRSGVNRRYA